MMDSEATLQQEALGIVGVNLVYGACSLDPDPDPDPELRLQSMLDNRTTDRIEIDRVEFSVIEFRNVDPRAMSLRLVQLGQS
ncbi:MAG TPA: hypothetical protein EYQ46_04205 [Myxococcales bacterium]|nr:hypothetical protein [Myxococcales bacterium]